MVPSGEGSVRGKLIPLERELIERLVWFTQLRWLAVVGISIGAWGATSFFVVGLSPLPFYGVAVVVSLYNLFFSSLRRRFEERSATTQSYRGAIYAQIGLDWIALICLVHYSGGIQSPVTLAFAFHVIIGAILLSRRSCYLQAALAVLLSTIMILLEQAGVWPLVPVDHPFFNPICTPEICSFRLLVLSTFLVVTAVLTTSITVPLRKKEEALFASEQALERAYGDMEALYEMGQAVNSTLDLDRVLGLIAENGARLMRMRACSIRLLEEDGAHMRIGAAYGLSETYLAKGPIELERSGIDAETLTGRTIQIQDVAADPRFQYPDEAQREGLRSVLCAPMLAQGKAIGCIRIYSGRPHQFSNAEENFLRNLANLGAVAISNARDFAALQVLSEERAWFARVTHHQLRAPLSAMRGLLDALRFAGELNDKQEDLVARSRRRIDELLEMIRDLLDLAAAQRPLVDQAEEPVVLFDCLGDTLEMVIERAAHKKVLLEIDAEDEEVVVVAETADVERIFANLLDNAVKYTPEGGKVRFVVRRDGAQVVMAVEDTGIGIKPEDQERIFQGFFRTEEAKSSGEMGTGMGMSIVKTLVERWGGRLRLESEPGEGSRFIVTLPGVERPRPTG